MPVRRNKLTGEIAEFDDLGNKIRTITPGTPIDKGITPRAKPLNIPALNPSSTIEPPLSLGQKVEAAINPATRAISEAIPIAGSVAASEVAPPLGSMGGFLGGKLVQRGLQNLSPTLFGTPPELPEFAAETAGTGALNLGTDVLGSGISKALSSNPEFKVALAKLFTKGGKGLDPDVATYLKANPDIPITTAQGSGSTAARLIENLLSPLRKKAVVEEQQKILQDKFKNLAPFQNLTKEQLAGGIKTDLLQGAKQTGQVVNQLYDNFYSAANSNHVLNKAGELIRGPVYLDRSSNLAKQIISRLQQAYEKQNVKQLYGALNEEQKPLLQMLQRIAGVQSGKTVNPVDARVAMDIKRITGGQGFKNLIPEGSEEGTFRKLNRLIDEDVKDSILGSPTKGRYGWKTNTQQAFQSYQAANKAHEIRMSIFRDNPAVSKLIESPLSGIGDVQNILKDPANIDSAIKGSSNPPLVKNYLKSEYLQDLFEKSHQKDLNQLDPNKAIELFTSRENEATAKRLFSAPERASLTQFFKTVKTLDPKLPLAGVTALGIRAAGAGLTLAAGVVPLLTSGSLGNGAERSALTLGAVLSANQMAHILSDPKIARYATQLAKLPPKSKMAQSLSKAIFLALKGEQIYLTMPNGAIVGKGDVNEQGKVEPIPLTSDTFGQ